MPCQAPISAVSTHRADITVLGVLESGRVVTTQQPEFGPGVSRFLAVLRNEAPGIRLTASAREEILRLFADAEQRIEGVAESRRDDVVQEAERALAGAIRQLVRRRLSLQQSGELDQSELQALMLSVCPLPPFCYGPNER
jgi:hypothetical protein